MAEMLGLVCGSLLARCGMILPTHCSADSDDCSLLEPAEPWGITVPAPTADDDVASLVPAPFTGWLTTERTELRRAARGGGAAARIAFRARLVRAVICDLRTISDVARSYEVTRDTVRLWVGRYRDAGTVAALSDVHRTGRNARITVRQQAVVLMIACQRPQDFGRCEGRMTHVMIAEEATKQGCSMKRSSVQRILSSSEVRPHREAYYLFTRKDDPEYIPRRDAICDIYTRKLPADEVVVCMDEKSGVQVLGTPKGTPHGGRRPPAYGQPGQLEQHYKRHGTRTLVGATRPDNGALVASAVFASGAYKTRETIGLLRAVRAALPDARVIHLVWDNGSTHRSAEMRAFLASDDGKCFNPLYTPTHASWLNLAENFLSRFSRRYLHGKRWTGLDAFDLDMDVCFKAYAGVAKPMRWRYNPREQAESTGRPTRRVRRGRRFLRPVSATRPTRS
jgi:transposase